MVIILFAQGREREEEGERGLIKKQTNQLNLQHIQKLISKMKGEKRGKRKVADQSPKAKSEDTVRGKKKNL